MPPGVRRAGCALISMLAVLAFASPPALAAPARLGKAVATQSLAGGAKRITYRIGPFDVVPGQNSIGLRPIMERPQVDGYVTRIKPDLTYVNGTVPRVDIIHLHHAVWVNTSQPDNAGFGFELFFAAGEEKTTLQLPKGYGYPLRRTDGLVLNHMIHNLTPTPTQVYMTYQLDFAPKGSAAARGIRPAHPVWMDVERGKIYPVFNVRKGSGRKGRFTYPDNAKNPYGGGPARNRWVVDKPGVLIGTGGHLHPGGLYTDLKLRRGNRTTRLFRSKAKYFEPAGAVSWDVAMTVTGNDWKVKVRKGDVLSVSATYDSRRASWWESMGIMVTYMADGGPGKNPFKQKLDRRGRVTHGHLPENNSHGGKADASLPDARTLPDGADNPGFVDLVNFRYQLGDLRLDGSAANPPVIHPGQSLTFRDAGDNAKEIYHSITSCKAPCNRTTGIAYPIADGDVQFESGTLGSQTPATGALQWQTPSNLSPGTYTYFCRIHPFMRGAFRVKQ